MTIRDIFRQEGECERLIERLEELQSLCNDEPYEVEVGYSFLEDLKDCITEFRKYITLIGNLDVYSLISDRLGVKE
jgi:hypothetical protein